MEYFKLRVVVPTCLSLVVLLAWTQTARGQQPITTRSSAGQSGAEKYFTDVVLIDQASEKSERLRKMILLTKLSRVKF